MTFSIPFAFLSFGVALTILALGGFMVFRHYDQKSRHLSVFQLFIRVNWFIVRWLQAVTDGLDVGYTQYRSTLQSDTLDLENEKQIGYVVGAG